MAIFPAMIALTVLPVDPEELRPLLHAGIDRLPDEQLELAHRVLLGLELEEVTSRLDEDRIAGKLARIPEMIREARGSLRVRQPS